jgi:threonine/homoserine/homoserine lactone efflux protein
MTALLAALAGWFEGLRWLGVAYLVSLGIRHGRTLAADRTETAAEPRFPARMFGRGLLVSLTNPKTLLFDGAFLPQFLTPGADVAG